MIYCMDNKKAGDVILTFLLGPIHECHFNLKIGIHIWDVLKYFHFDFLAKVNQKLYYRSSASYLSCKTLGYLVITLKRFLKKQK